VELDSPSLRGADAAADAAAIARCLERDNAWSGLRAWTRAKDLRDVADMCHRINPAAWAALYVTFYDAVLRHAETYPAALRERDAALPPAWFTEPFYYAYVQYFGTPSGDGEAGFDDLAEMLGYLEAGGVRNLFLLPHYESPMADGGYDVSDYAPRASLGGAAAWGRFMDAAVARGFRVVTDLPINHTSVRHPWFRAALAGDRRKLAYYLRRDGRVKLGERERGGDLVAIYRDPDGTLSERVLIFPDVDRCHEARFEIDGQQVQLYREFYPFELDLDLQQPTVLAEIFELLGRELRQGVLGKRADAVAHWIKRPGTPADGLPETHALQALIKSFMRHVCPRAVVLPEAVRGAAVCASYAGMATEIAGQAVCSEGDALFNFELQGALREMLYLGTSTPFWRQVFTIPELPTGAVWLNLLEHHDETYLGMISSPNRERLAALIEQGGGQRYKNGMSAGCRYADALGKDPRRIATAIFCLYLMPGVPVLYYGTELGARNQPRHARAMQARQHRLLRELGGEIELERCYDPRELQRGPIPAADFDAAEREEALPYATWRAMNRLRERRASLRGVLLTPIDNGHDSVLSLVRFAGESSDQPLLALANLRGETRELRLPREQLEEKLGIAANARATLVDLLAADGAGLDEGDMKPLSVEAEADLFVRLEPYAHRLLESATEDR